MPAEPSETTYPVDLQPPTPGIVETDGVPFPSTENEDRDASPTTFIQGNTTPSPPTPRTPDPSPESQATASTSSDKVSSLRHSSTILSNGSRIPRPPGSSIASANRFYRHSLDGATTSIPAFSMADMSPQSTSSTSHKSGRNGSPLLSPGERFTRDRFERGSSNKESPRQASSRFATKGSDPRVSTPKLRGSPYVEQLDSPKEFASLPNSRSPSPRSRAASPLRRLQQWSTGLHRSNRPAAEEPFVPINPFRMTTHFRLSSCLCGLHSAHKQDVEHNANTSSSSNAYGCDDLLPISSVKSFVANMHILTDTIPRQVYLHLLLRLPSMYFSRVARIFEDAEVSKPDIQRMIEAGGGASAFVMMLSSPARGGAGGDAPNMSPVLGSYPPTGTLSPTGLGLGLGLTAHIGAAPASVPQVPLPFPEDWTISNASPALMRFKHSWEAFIDSLLREWKTLNLTSALLASGILSTFQVPDMAADPVTRTAAVLSLVCAIMSLSYGCIYILRFGTMRSMYKASRWAEEARKDYTLIWWNVWVLLAMPTIWLAWSMLLFLVAILSYVWRTGSVSDPEIRGPLSARAILGPRIVITAVLVLGLIYMAMIVKTLKRYGSQGGMRGILNAGSPRIGSPIVGGTGGNVDRAMAKARTRDIDAAMERRGREKERSSSVRAIRRKEGVERRNHEPAEGPIQPVTPDATLGQERRAAGAASSDMIH